MIPDSEKFFKNKEDCVENGESNTDAVKGENIPDNQDVGVCAERLYREAEKAFLTLVRINSFDKHEDRYQFNDLLGGMVFGPVSFLKGKELLHFAIGGHGLGPDYLPAREHILAIREFLLSTGENRLKIVGEIEAGIAAALEAAYACRRNLLYPEIKDMQEEIESLHRRLAEKDRQLRFSLETWTMLAHEIDSSLSRANLRVYAVMNELANKEN